MILRKEPLARRLPLNFPPGGEGGMGTGRGGERCSGSGSETPICVFRRPGEPASWSPGKVNPTRLPHWVPVVLQGRTITCGLTSGDPGQWGQKVVAWPGSFLVPHVSLIRGSFCCWEVDTELALAGARSRHVGGVHCGWTVR